MEPNLINVGEKKITFKWLGFLYEFEAGEAKHVAPLPTQQLLKRFPDALKIYKPSVKKKKEKDAVD